MQLEKHGTLIGGGENVYKPYYYWDTMFGDRPSVTRGSYDNKYESAMATKVGNWYDGKRKV